MHPQLLDLAMNLRGFEGDAERCEREDRDEQHFPSMPLQEVTQLTQLILQSRSDPYR